MIIKNTTMYELIQALDEVNELYDNNIEFNRFEHVTNTSYAITLKVKDSNQPGHRSGNRYSENLQHYNRLISACWHVHGNFFDMLWAINSKIVIKTTLSTMSSPADNWQDSEYGSPMKPRRYSEMCECN